VAKRGRRKRARVDWNEARRLYEFEQKSFAELSELFGCKPHTVSAHAKREGWINGRAIGAESAAERREKIWRDFIDRDAEAVRANLAQKHRLTSRVMGLAEKHIERLELGHALIIGTGTNVVEEDPLLSLRRVSLVLQNVEVIDRSLAGLKGDGWRSDAGDGGADTEAHEERVRRALERRRKR